MSPQCQPGLASDPHVFNRRVDKEDCKMTMLQGWQEEEEGEGTRRCQQAAGRYPPYQGEQLERKDSRFNLVTFSAV